MKVQINKNKAFEVKLLTNKDSLSIQNIWRECFTQDINYINNFIEYCLPHSISWGLFPYGTKEAVAMLSLLPSYTIFEQTPNTIKKANGAYIYGVGTLKSHRGNDYSQILMTEAIRYSTHKSFDYILVKPAEESLFNLYQKQSFNKTLYCYCLEIPITKSSTFTKTNNTSQINNHAKHNTQNYHLNARESLAKTNFLWPTQILNYSLMEIRSRDGITSYIKESNNNNFNQTKTAPLFYSAYPIEENVQTIKVADHNIKNSYQLELSINDITSHFPYAKKIIFDFPLAIDLELFSSYTYKPIITKNALIKILNTNSEIEKALLDMYLTLSME